MKKLLSLLLCMTIILALIPADGAFATENEMTYLLFEFDDESDYTMIPNTAANSRMSWRKGLAGKLSDDSSAKVMLNYYDENGNIAETKNGFLHGLVKWVKDDKQSFSKYIVFEANVSPRDVDDIFFATNSNHRITPNIRNYLSHYTWNSIVTAVKIDDGTTVTYVNGKKAAESSTDFGDEAYKEIRLVITDSMGGGTAYVDDIKVYETSCLPSAGEYYTGEKEVFSPRGNFGDYTYFNNHYCDVSTTATYKNLTQSTSGSGTVTANRLINHKSSTRTDNIVLSQSDSQSESSITVNITKSKVTNTTIPYSYLHMEADLTKTSPGSTDSIFELRGSRSGKLPFTPVTISPNGEIQFSDGTVATQVVKSGTTVNICLALNFVDRIYDVYIDGEKEGDAIEIPDRIYDVNKVSIALQKGGAGELDIDNFIITGTVNPYIDGSYEKTDAFSDSEAEAAFLEDKSAIYAPAENLFADGRKSAIPTLYFDSQKLEVYVPQAAIQRIIGTDDTPDSTTMEVDGVTLYAAKEYAENCGWNVAAVKNGLFIFSENAINLEYSDWDYISFKNTSGGITELNAIDYLSAFMTYDRPDAEELKDAFGENTASGTHPRLLLKSGDFDRLRNMYNVESDSHNPGYRKIALKMIDLADECCDDEVETYTFDDIYRTLNTAERLLNKFRYWGFAYQITKNQKYADRAYREFEAMASFPDFNTAHIIDTGEYAAAAAFGYDWMYEGFTSKQREFIENLVMEKILRPLASGLYGGLTSSADGGYSRNAFTWASNYNAIVNGGILTAAIAFMECDEDFCLQAISDSLKSAEYAFMLLAPDGGWVESFTYWNFCMQYMIYENAACETAFGTSYGLAESDGFANTVNYAAAAIGQNGINNYHDAGQNPVSETLYSYDTFAYLAKRFNSPEAAAMRAYSTGKGSRGFFDALYYDVEAAENYEEVLASLDTVQKIDGIELFSVRDTFDKDNGKLYFSTHFGPTSCYHSQNDTGTFVLDLLGERWAYDLGSDNYLLQNELGYKQSELYRYRSEGHNTFTINNSAAHNQTQNMFFDIDTYEYNDKSAYMIAELPYLYKDVPEMKMGYFIGDNKSSVTMRSELTADKDSEIYWFMHISEDTEVEISGNSAILTKNGKQVKLDFLCSDPAAVLGEMAAQPLESSPSVAEQSDNGEYKKLYIKFNATEDMEESITVKISSIIEGHENTPVSDTELDEWILD